nr:MAG TPA: hypothetical protein [Crassvirales sp.]
MFFKVYNNPLSRLVLCQSKVSSTPTMTLHYRRLTPKSTLPSTFSHIHRCATVTYNQGIF